MLDVERQPRKDVGDHPLNGEADDRRQNPRGREQAAQRQMKDARHDDEQRRGEDDGAADVDQQLRSAADQHRGTAAPRRADGIAQDGGAQQTFGQPGGR